eukprot:Skav213579  [mRNA]  locus=scaffold1790:236891:238542:- [translate_table: standard]
MDSQDKPGSELRSWFTVALGLTNTLFFSGILFGWASLQSFLEDDHFYEELCDLSTECEERKDRMLYLYSNGISFSIFAYAFLSFVMDRTGPVFLCVVGGLLQTFGLALLGYADVTKLQFSGLPIDIMDFAVSIVGIGGSAIMVHALKLAFIVPANRFAWVMTLVNCMVDASAAMPALLYQLRRLGISRQSIFTTFAALCLALNVLLVLSWFGPNLEKLRSKNARESSDEVSAPRLHGLRIFEQLRSFEFAFAFVIYLTQGFAVTSYMGFNKNLLSSLGDDDNVYAQVFTAMVPASILFSPLFGMSLAKKGFAFTFALVLLLGLTWSSLTLLPSLQVQPTTFFVFSNYRAMLYASHFTFLAHSFGNRTFGSINAILSVLAALLAWLIGPLVALSQKYTGSLLGMSSLIIVSMLPCAFLIVQLAKHLRTYPAGDVCSLHQQNAKSLEGSSESASSEESTSM